MSNNQDISQEERILLMMKKVLTDVAKETFTKPGYSHPLSDNTIHNIRECLTLISVREHEIRSNEGRASTARPRYVDEPRDSVVVPIESLKNGNDNNEKE